MIKQVVTTSSDVDGSHHVKETAVPRGRSTDTHANYAVMILVVCYTLAFVDRQILSLLVGPIKRDLALSDTLFGLLSGLAFALFYTFMGLPIGRLVDTLNRRNIVVVGVTAWSIMTALCAGTRSFAQLFVARIGVGVGEATLSPAAFSMIADYFPKERLGLALSIYSMGIFIGSGLAFLIGGAVVDAVVRLPSVSIPVLGTIASWRLTFLIVGLPGLVVALLALTVREPLRRNLLKTTEGQIAKLGLREILSQLRLRWTSVIGISAILIFSNATFFAFTAWAPAFFARVHGWTPGQTGRAVGIIVICFGCAGMYVGGSLCNRWLRQGVEIAPLKVAFASGIGVALSLPLALILPDAGWTTALLAPALFFVGLPIGSLFGSAQLIFPNQMRGIVSAVVLFILNLGGQTLGPLGPGVLNDYVFHDERNIGASMALTVGAASVLMAIIARATYAPYRKHYRMMHHRDSPVQQLV